MSRSNYDKPFYVDICTSIVAIRFASNNDVIVQYDYTLQPHTLELAKDVCDRMNKEVEIRRPLRNCDVGTVAEQKERFLKFKGYIDKLTICPDFSRYLYHDLLCWAQMPYKAECIKKGSEVTNDTKTAN